MKQPILLHQDFKGGMTLNEKMGGEDQFDRGYRTDIYSKKGKVGLSYDWTTYTQSSSDVTTEFRAMQYTSEDDRVYFGGENEKIYYQANTGNILTSTVSTQSGEIRDMEEFNDYLYFTQDTTIGRKDLSASAIGGYTFAWQSGLESDVYHPIYSMDGKMYIGHKNYIAEENPDLAPNNWTPQKLDLADNWRIRCLGQMGYIYLAIGANYHSGSDNASSKSKIFLWNRASATWQDEIPLPETEIKAMIYTAGYLWIWAGRNCNLYVVPEGSRSVTRMFEFYKEDPTAGLEVYPNSVIERYGKVYFALSGVDITSYDKNPGGIYSFPSDPNDFTLTMPYKATNAYDWDCKSLTLNRTGGANDVDIIMASENLQTGNDRLIREEIYSGEAFYSGTGDIESFQYQSPPNKQIVTEAFGMEFEEIPSGCRLSMSYKTDNDSGWTTVISSAQHGGIEKIAHKRMTCNSLKVKVSMNGPVTGANRPFLERFYVTGHLKSKK